MAETPKPFQHVDGGLSDQLRSNVVDTSRPFMERFMSGVALIAARGVLEEANKTSLLLPGTAAQPAPPAASLPKPGETS